MRGHGDHYADAKDQGGGRQLSEMAKKHKELVAGKRVADWSNAERRTDYEAIPGKEEPIDVILESRSGTNPSLAFQVTEAPPLKPDESLRKANRGEYFNRRGQALAMRGYSDAVTKFEKALSEALEGGGAGRLDALISLQNNAHLHGVRDPALQDLVHLIVNAPENTYTTYRDLQLYEFSPKLSESVLSVRVVKSKELNGISLACTRAGYVPRDGSWIEESLEKKNQHYSPEAASAVGLIIVASPFIDRDQIRSFREQGSACSSPFRDIYLLSDFCGVQRLK